MKSHKEQSGNQIATGMDTKMRWPRRPVEFGWFLGDRNLPIGIFTGIQVDKHAIDSKRVIVVEDDLGCLSLLSAV